MQIPIENIYYLLCYAWNKLEEQGRVGINATDCHNLPDLFAKVLASGTRILLKRGVDKQYQVTKEEVAGIKGKLEYSETGKRNLFYKQKSICSFDEFSTDILINRILFTTIGRLARTRGLDSQLKDELRRLTMMLDGIEPIAIESKMFRQIRLNRNNRFYGFLMHICELVHESLLVTEQAGQFQFADFTRDEKKMNQLFEHFILNFYRREQREYPHVGSEWINWQFEASDEQSRDYLPKMQTDISLSNDSHKIIIDAKYYREAMVTHYERDKVRSANLYQLFSYLVNQEGEDERSRHTSGILLYPTTGEEYNLSYQFREHRIKVQTVNLNQEWRGIENRLLEILI